LVIFYRDNKEKEPIEPYEAFEIWLRENGYQDILDSKPLNVDLQRLGKAIEEYGET